MPKEIKLVILEKKTSTYKMKYLYFEDEIELEKTFKNTEDLLAHIHDGKSINLKYTKKGIPTLIAIGAYILKGKKYVMI